MSQVRYLSRRDLLLQAGGGIGGLALADMLGRESLFAASPEAKAPSAGEVM